MKIEDKDNIFNEYQPNNIYNVDCYEAIKKIPDKSIDLVYVDIPYLIDSGGCSDNELSKRAKRLRNIELEDIRHGIDYSIFEEFCRVLKKIYLYIWCNKNQIYDVMKYFIEKGCYYELIVWCKTNPTPLTNNTMLPNIEYLLMFREKGCKLYGDYNTKSKWYISPINKSDKDLYCHPTIKPLEFVKNHILNATKENDIVLDCFLGSGTTAVACKELNRRYIGFEINKDYFKIAQDRINGISQIDNKLKEAGIQTIFDFME